MLNHLSSFGSSVCVCGLGHVLKITKAFMGLDQVLTNTQEVTFPLSEKLATMVSK
jgi:hypothetical protein